MTLKSKKHLRIVLYLRRSVDDGDTTRSLPEQEVECTRFAESIGTIVDVVRENGSGVTGKDRPKFVKMIEAAERGACDAIVCFDCSRFGRFEVDEWGYWLHRLKIAGVTVRLVHGDLSAYGEMAPVMGAMNQHGANQQSVKTALHVTRGHIGAVAKGCWPGGKAPLGYRVVKRKGWDGKGSRDSTLLVVESEAATVREAFRLYLTGIGYQRVVHALNESGHRTRKGCEFTVGAINKVLSNPVYKGELSRGKERRGQIPAAKRSDSKFYRGSSKGPIKVGEPCDGYEKQGAVPALVSSDDWERVQEIARSRTREHTGGRPGLFARLARCGVCGGGSVRKTWRRAKGEQEAVLVCRQCREKGPAKVWGECRFVSVNYRRLTACIRELLLAEDQPDPEELAAQIRAALPSVPKVDIKALETRRTRLEARRDELLLSDNEDFARAGLAKLAAEHARLGNEIEAARQAEALSPDIEAMVQSAVEANVRLESCGTDEGDESLRALFKIYLKRVEILPAPFKAPRPVEVEYWTSKAVAVMSGAHSFDPDLTRSPGPGRRS